MLSVTCAKNGVAINGFHSQMEETYELIAADQLNLCVCWSSNFFWEFGEGLICVRILIVNFETQESNKFHSVSLDDLLEGVSDSDFLAIENCMLIKLIPVCVDSIKADADCSEYRVRQCSTLRGSYRILSTSVRETTEV